jgi:hypothetical protein
MKDYSCAQIKRGFKVALHQEPKEGSKVRVLFDLFTEFKGQIIDFGKLGSASKKDIVAYRDTYMRIKYLNSFYGMDIRHLGKGKYCFQGEYIGARYVSYENKHPLHIKMKER